MAGSIKGFQLSRPGLGTNRGTSISRSYKVDVCVGSRGRGWSLLFAVEKSIVKRRLDVPTGSQPSSSVFPVKQQEFISTTLLAAHQVVHAKNMHTQRTTYSEHWRSGMRNCEMITISI